MRGIDFIRKPGLVATDVPALPSHEGVHLPAPVDAVVLRMQPGDLGHEQIILQLPRGRRAAHRGAIAA